MLQCQAVKHSLAAPQLLPPCLLLISFCSWMGQHRTCPLCRHVLYEQPDSPDHSMQPLGVAAPGPQQQAAPRNRSSRPGAQS